MAEKKKLDISESNLAGKALNLEYSFHWDVDRENRIIRISGDIDSESFSLFDAKITELESLSRRAITIRINSGGGHVYEALAIVGRMRASKCKIITEGYGHIMSAATAILAAGDERKMSKYAHFMHHEMSMEVGGRTSELELEIEQMKAEEVQWANLMEELTGTSAANWISVSKGGNYYMSAQKCLEAGVVDKLI